MAIDFLYITPPGSLCAYDLFIRVISLLREAIDDVDLGEARDVHELGHSENIFLGPISIVHPNRSRTAVPLQASSTSREKTVRC